MKASKRTALWTSLLTLLSTVGILALNDAQIAELSGNVEQFVTYGGIIIAAIVGALGITAKE